MKYIAIIIFICLLSMVIFLWEHLFITWKYKEAYKDAFNEYTSVFDRLMITAGVIRSFSYLLSDSRISNIERITYTILFLVTLPAAIIIAIIVYMRYYFIFSVEEIKNKRKGNKDE